MSRFKLFAASSCLGLMALAFLPARADQWNKKTILTVNEAVALPNTVLQPGKYVMKLMDSQSTRHVVQVFDEGEQNLITTILAIPNYRLTPANDTSFGYWETTAGQPRALRSWFYPGDNFGQEFAYPKDQALRIAQASNENVPVIMSEEANAQAEVRTMTPSGETRELETREQQTSAAASDSTTTDQQPAATPTTEQPAAAQEQSATASAETQSSQPADESLRTGTGTGSSTAEESRQAQPQTDASASAQAPAPDSSATASAEVQAPATDSSATASAQTDQSGIEGSARAESRAAGQDTGMTASAERSELPRTASPLPLIALAGVASAAAAAAARVARKRG